MAKRSMFQNVKATCQACNACGFAAKIALLIQPAASRNTQWQQHFMSQEKSALVADCANFILNTLKQVVVFWCKHILIANTALKKQGVYSKESLGNSLMDSALR